MVHKYWANKKSAIELHGNAKKGYEVTKVVPAKKGSGQVTKYSFKRTYTSPERAANKIKELKRGSPNWKRV